MVFLFPNLPTELSFMIEDYVLLFYKEIHKQKLAKVMDEYKATNRIHITMPKWKAVKLLILQCLKTFHIKTMPLFK